MAKYEQKQTLPLDLWCMVWSFADVRSHFTTLPLISTTMRSLSLTQRTSWPPMPHMPSNITDSVLRNLPSYRYLDLTRCKRITDAGLAHISTLTSLQHLDLDNCTRITDAGLAHLSTLTSLQHLDLNNCTRITDAGLAHISTLTSLQHLYLSFCPSITDAGLAHLSTLTSLQHLNLYQLQSNYGCRDWLTSAL